MRQAHGRAGCHPSGGMAALHGPARRMHNAAPHIPDVPRTGGRGEELDGSRAPSWRQGPKRYSIPMSQWPDGAAAGSSKRVA